MQDFLIPPLSLPPVRGIVPLHNYEGIPFRLADIHRAIRFQCRAFNVLKLDLLTLAPPAPGILESCLAFAREFQVQLALRAPDSAIPRERLRAWRDQGLFEVCVAQVELPLSQDTLEACHAAGLPVRLLLPVSTALGAPVALWAGCGVRQVTLLQPYATAPPATDIRTPLEAAGVAVSFPVCAMPERLISNLDIPDDTYFHDIANYQREAYLHAAALFSLSPRAAHARLIFDNLLLSGIVTPSDHWLVHFLRLYTPFYPGLETASRLVRHGAGEPLRTRAEPPANSAPAHPQYFDLIDLERLRRTEQLDALAREACAWEAAQPPTRTFETQSWAFEYAFHHPMPGVNQIHSLLPGEKRSSPLPFLQLPCMATVNFGAGMADLIGFSIGRHIRIACPMVATAHQLTLYADEAGRYVLLRDGRPTLPVDLAGRGYTPARLPAGMHLQVTVWNPESALSVTAVRTWEGALLRPQETQSPVVSVIVFSTRFSRRLQAVLESLAHQRGLPLAGIQCLVAFVPGIDAAEDVLDSIRRIYPGLAIEPVALPAAFANAKGFALNECLAQVRSPLTVLLDSDILLPPDFLRAALDAAGEHPYLAPAGRAMLDADVTARVLLGKTLPWDHFADLAASAPEMRIEENKEQIPLGYCQVFRSTCLDTIRYHEYDHFQGADYEFGIALRDHFGNPHRLPLPVLHLHHETRQWFGAQKQY